MVAQDNGLMQMDMNNGQDVYISSSIDVVENVGKGNNCSSRSPKENLVKGHVKINSGHKRPAGEAPGRVNAKLNVDHANVTKRQKPQDPGIYAKGAIDGIKVNFTIDSGASLTSVSC